VWVWAEGGALKIRWTQPKRRQKTYFHRDTPENRRVLVEIATALAERIRHPMRSRRPRKGVAAIRWRDVWLRYLRARWPNLPEQVIHTGGRAAVAEYFNDLPESIRARVPSPRYLLSTLQAMARVSAFPPYALAADVTKAQPADWEAYTFWRLAQPVPGRPGRYYEVSTVETDYRRLNAALQYCIKKWPAWWGERRNPLSGAKVEAPERKTVPELGEEGARQILAELRRNLRTQWRAYASLAIGMETARRISEIGPATLSFAQNTLCARDFHRGEDGRLYVNFRAATLKGRNFRRGDLTIPATRGLEVIYRYLRRFHPNPCGADAPLLWSPSNPRVPVSYTAVRAAFVKAWRATHDGADPPRGLKFHSVCYTTITTLVETVGLERTAEFVGRSVQTIERIYKRVRTPTQLRTAEALDAARAHWRRRPVARVKPVQAQSADHTSGDEKLAAAASGDPAHYRRGSRRVR
jgi:integrase